MDRIVLTLDRILDRYFYKEWVEEELENVGEPKSGDKDALIKRFLNSDRIRNRSVNEIAANLLGSLRVSDLKQIAEDLGMSTHGKHGQLLRRILDSVTFEPYVKRATRPCAICLKETRHELHFRSDWQADHFKCDVCGTKTSAHPPKDGMQSVRPILNEVIDIQFIGPDQASRSPSNKSENEAEGPTLSGSPPIVDGSRNLDSVSRQALAWTVVSIGVAVFLTVFVSVTPAYGWLVGIIAGIVATILAGIILVPTRHHWMPLLLRMIQ